MIVLSAISQLIYNYIISYNVINKQIMQGRIFSKRSSQRREL